MAFPLFAAMFFSPHFGERTGRFGLWGSTSDGGAAQISTGSAAVSKAPEGPGEPDATLPAAPILSPEKGGASTVGSVVNVPSAARLHPQAGRPSRPLAPTPSMPPPHTTDCDIPYEVDATGKRNYKRHCLE